MDSSPSHSGGTSVGGSITQAEALEVPRRHYETARHHPTKETKEGMGPSPNIREDRGFKAEVMEKKDVSVTPQGVDLVVQSLYSESGHPLKSGLIFTR